MCGAFLIQGKSVDRKVGGSRGLLTPTHIHRATASTANHVLRRGQPKVGEEDVTAILTAENVFRFNITVGDTMFMAVLDGRKHLQKYIADPVFLCAVMIGSDRSEEITAAVEVEDEEISGEAAMDTVVTKANVGVEGDCVGDVFVTLDLLLHMEFLG